MPGKKISKVTTTDLTPQEKRLLEVYRNSNEDEKADMMREAIWVLNKYPKNSQQMDDYQAGAQE